MWLVKCLKSLISEHLATVNMLNSLKTTAIPSYCSITLVKIGLDNVHLSISEILGVLVNTLTADNKYSLRNMEDLPEPIQLQLFNKQNNFSQFFAAYLKSKSNFEHFEKQEFAQILCIFEMRYCERLWLVKCLKSLVSKHLAKVNRLNSLKTCTTAVRSYYLIILAKIELENVCLSISKILRVLVGILAATDKYSVRITKN